MKIFAASVLTVLGILAVFGMKSTEEVAPIFLTQMKTMAPAAELNMLIVGDIMLGRNVQLLGERLGADYPFRNIESFLKQSDIVAGNLEGPIVAGAPRTEANSFKFVFPTSSPWVLKTAGFNLLSLANNHAVDFGSKGYKETVDRLVQEGIDSFGHPLYGGAAYAKKFEQNGKKIAFFGYNATYPSFDRDSALSDIFAERASSSDELIFVFMHWGEEYSLSANDFQIQLARGLIDSGATAIVGSHPHVVQGIEVYKDRPIFYSLGNFIFDQYFSKDTQEGLMILVKIQERKITYGLVPIASVRSKPEFMNAVVRGEWLKELSVRSDAAAAEGVSAGSFDLSL